MEDLSAGDLAITVSTDGDAIRLTWRGKSSDRHPGAVLGPYLAAALSEAAAQSTSLELLFDALEHFNSSTVTVLVQLIQDAKKRGVPLRFFYDSKLRWQKLSFEALKVFVNQGSFELCAK